jgi:hypothetical protein
VKEQQRRGESSLPSMSRIYHPDKHNSGFTGMSDEKAVEFFQHLNNAHSYLRGIMLLIQKKETNMKDLTMNYDLETKEDIPSQQSIYLFDFWVHFK